MKIAVIIQARFGSTRLPGKVLKKIKDRMIIDYVIDRIKLCKKVDDIILATTIDKIDDEIKRHFYETNKEDIIVEVKKTFYQDIMKLQKNIIQM